MYLKEDCSRDFGGRFDSDHKCIIFTYSIFNYIWMLHWSKIILSNVSIEHKRGT